MTVNLNNPGLVVCQAVILLSCAFLGRSQIREQHVASGKCPTFAAFKTFNLTQFQGSWFVSYQYGTAKFRTCQNLNFRSTRDTPMTIESYGTTNDCVKTLELKGTSHSSNPEIPGAMTWYWDHPSSLPDHVTVVDTDHDNYAVLVLCNDLGHIHLNYALLLTRQENVPDNAALVVSYVNKIHRVIQPLLSLSEYPFDLNNCPEPCSATNGKPEERREKAFIGDHISRQEFAQPQDWAQSSEYVKKSVDQSRDRKQTKRPNRSVCDWFFCGRERECCKQSNADQYIKQLEDILRYAVEAGKQDIDLVIQRLVGLKEGQDLQRFNTVEVNATIHKEILETRHSVEGLKKGQHDQQNKTLKVTAKIQALEEQMKQTTTVGSETLDLMKTMQGMIDQRTHQPQAGLRNAVEAAKQEIIGLVKQELLAGLKTGEDQQRNAALQVQHLTEEILEMKQTNARLRCSPAMGMTRTLWGCFKGLHNVNRTWSEASDHCAALGLELASLDKVPTMQELVRIGQDVGLKEQKGFYWVGLRRNSSGDGVWRWLSGARMDSGSPLWRNGDPSNGSGEDAGWFWVGNGLGDDKAGHKAFALCAVP